MHRLTLNTLVGMLALTTSTSEPNQIKVNNSHSRAIVKIDKKSTLVIPTTAKSALVQRPIKLASADDAYSLIKPTDGKQRAEEVLLGRSDPFSGISYPLPAKPQPKPQKVFPLSALPIALDLPTPAPKPVKPEPPLTNLAKAISVEGVMGIGNSRHAIVKLPHDASSRYVAEGQELLGGRVLVKAIKIDATNSDAPTVIFEQNGVEVAAGVGFKPDNKNNTGLTESDSTVASTSSPMSILTADVAAKQVSSKPADEVAYRPPSPPVSSTNPDSQRVKPNQQPPFNSSSVSVALNKLPIAKKLSPPTGFGKNKLDAKSVDLKPRLSSTERYKQLVYRLRYSRGGSANNTTPGVDEANTRFAQHSFEQLVSDGRDLGNNGEDARATSSSQLNLEQKAKAYRQLVDRLRYGSNVDRQY